MTELKLPIKLHKFNPSVGVVAQKSVNKLYRRRIAKKLCNKVWNDYLDIFKQELLENGQAAFVYDIGSLHVYKYPIDRFPKYMEYVAKGTRKPQSTNLNRINYVYRIKYVRGGKVMWVRFSASEGLKKELTEILNNTEKDYRPAPIKARNEYQ